MNIICKPGFISKNGQASSSLIARELSRSHNVDEFSLISLISADIFLFHWPERLLAKGRFFSLGFCYILRISKKILGFKAVWIVHNVLPHENYCDDQRIEFYKTLASSCDKLIFPLNSSQQIFIEEYGQYDNLVVSPFGMYLNKENVTDCWDYDFIFFGILDGYKNIVESVTQLLSNKPSVNIMIAGKVGNIDVNELNQLKEFNNVTLELGHIKEDRLEYLLDISEYVVFNYTINGNSGALRYAASKGKKVIINHSSLLEEQARLYCKEYFYFDDICNGIYSKNQGNQNRPSWSDFVKNIIN